jgi:hypothetical protein
VCRYRTLPQWIIRHDVAQSALILSLAEHLERRILRPTLAVDLRDCTLDRELRVLW